MKSTRFREARLQIKFHVSAQHPSGTSTHRAFRTCSLGDWVTLTALSEDISDISTCDEKIKVQIHDSHILYIYHIYLECRIHDTPVKLSLHIT